MTAFYESLLPGFPSNRVNLKSSCDTSTSAGKASAGPILFRVTDHNFVVRIGQHPANSSKRHDFGHRACGIAVA